MSEEDKICFVIAPIGEADTDTRKRSDQVLKHIISPAVEQCGYKAIRADQISEPGIITSQIIQHVVDDPLVVADLTGRNPNVFYELAVRHALRKPLVQLIRRGEQIPFDVAGTRTIQVDHTDLDSAEEAKKEITRQVESLESQSSPVESPISVSLDLQILRQSDDPEQRSLADLLSEVAELRKGLTNVEARVHQPEQLLPRSYFDHLMKEYLLPREARHELMELRDMLERANALSNALHQEILELPLSSAESADRVHGATTQLADLTRAAERIISKYI